MTNQERKFLEWVDGATITLLYGWCFLNKDANNLMDRCVGLAVYAESATWTFKNYKQNQLFIRKMVRNHFGWRIPASKIYIYDY